MIPEKNILISHSKCDSENISETVAKAVEELKKSGGGKLIFEKGEYHFKKRRYQIMQRYRTTK